MTTIRQFLRLAVMPVAVLLYCDACWGQTDERATPDRSVHESQVVKNDAGSQRELTVDLGGGVNLQFVRIPAGEFLMGNGRSVEEERAHVRATYGVEVGPLFFADEYPQHRVRITGPFYLGVTHVTVGQFRRFVSNTGFKTDAEKVDATGKKGAVGFNTSLGQDDFAEGYCWRKPGFEQTDEHPVVCVSWNDAVAFCDWLGRRDGGKYRLPTEAEWEYACRAGTTTRYWCGDDAEGLAKIANVADGTAKKRLPNLRLAIHGSDGYVFTSPVGSFPANPFGLFDMHGNAWQWCADEYGYSYYQSSPVNDPTGPNEMTRIRVLRGGSWDSVPLDGRSAYRFKSGARTASAHEGFRIARDDKGKNAGSERTEGKMSNVHAP